MHNLLFNPFIFKFPSFIPFFLLQFLLLNPPSEPIGVLSAPASLATWALLRTARSYTCTIHIPTSTWHLINPSHQSD